MSEESKKNIKEYIITIVVTAAICLAFTHFVQISRVVGSSMENTYHDNNILLVDKTFYDEDDAKYKDIVIVDATNYGLDEQIIKRVIGVAGDHIVIKDNQLYINDQLIEEDYIKEEMTSYETIDVTVPEHCVFVMGDNRNNSLDSRVLGCINFDDVVGRVFLKVF